MKFLGNLIGGLLGIAFALISFVGQIALALLPFYIGFKLIFG